MARSLPGGERLAAFAAFSIQSKSPRNARPGLCAARGNAAVVCHVTYFPSPGKCAATRFFIRARYLLCRGGKDDESARKGKSSLLAARSNDVWRGDSDP